MTAPLPLSLLDGAAKRPVVDSLSEAWWTPFLLLGVVVAVGLWMLPSLVKHRGRAEKIRRVAVAAGHRFQEQDGPGLANNRFRLLVPDRRSRWVATNVVAADYGSVFVHVFDARTYTEHEVDQLKGRSKTIRRGQGPTITAAIVRLPSNAPRTLITHENLVSKLFVTATRLDLDVESDLFNTSYHVISEDRRFARDLLEARLIDLIVQGEGRMAFEFFGNRLLVTAPLLEPELFPGLAGYVQQFPGVVGAVLGDRWPDASGIETRRT